MSTPDLFPAPPRTSPSRRPKLRTILIAAIVLIAVIAGVIAFAVFQKPNGKAGAQALVQDYLTAVSEARVADARALVYNASETPGDPEVQQAALDAATERISNVITFEAYEVGEDALGFAVPYAYTLAGLESRGEFLVMENADGELVLKIDDGAGIVSTPSWRDETVYADDYSLPALPEAQATIGGVSLGDSAMHLYPGTYPLAVSPSFFTFRSDADNSTTDAITVGSGAARPGITLVPDSDAIMELVDGIDAAPAAKAAADAHFPSCSVASAPNVDLADNCGSIDMTLPFIVGKATYTWTFGSYSTIDETKTTTIRIREDGTVEQSYRATVGVSLFYSEKVFLSNTPYERTVEGTATESVNVVTHPDGTQEAFVGGIPETE